jgi:hypothetical protein
VRKPYIQVENVAKVFLKHLSARLLDLLEIATYVFAADCAVSRESTWNDEETPEPWDRDFLFVIPVRDLNFWQQSEVQKLLSETLSFLADESYAFTFQRLKTQQIVQDYLQFCPQKLLINSLSQSLEQQAEHAELHHGFPIGGQPLIVPAMAAIIEQPGNRALHRPAPRHPLKALALVTRHRQSDFLRGLQVSPPLPQPLRLIAPLDPQLPSPPDPPQVRR